jgi:hypothetical protein
MLLPAHLDTLVQTSPRPEPEPFIDYFLHGPGRGAPDVYVVWRSDIDGIPFDGWAEVVALCPPTSSEAMPVPLWVFRQWFEGGTSRDESDVEVVWAAHEEEDASGRKSALIWRGADDARMANGAADFLPGDTVVLPASNEAWNVFGFKPEESPADRGDEARLLLRKRICLRLHSLILDGWEECTSRDELRKLVSREDADPEEVLEALKDYPEEFRPRALKESWNLFTAREKISISQYPEKHWEKKKSKRSEEVLLEGHLKHVETAADGVTGDVLPPALKRAVIVGARYHDYGKAAVRCQAWLRNGNLLAAEYVPKPIAKSGKTTLRRQTECGLADGFRHELLSLLFAAKAADVESDIRDLALHLIASHHGRCRPHAPIVIDKQAACVSFGGFSVCSRERVEKAPHALGSGVASAFGD